MKQTVYKDDFKEAFRWMGRGDQFTSMGLDSLYDYLVDFEEDTGSELELDVIAICCDFTEYADIEELQGSYPDIKTIEELEDHTTVIPVIGDSFIIQNF